MANRLSSHSVDLKTTATATAVTGDKLLMYNNMKILICGYVCHLSYEIMNNSFLRCICFVFNGLSLCSRPVLPV
jgi:hypothetical protein